MDPPKNHSFSLSIIQLALKLKQKTSSSFRAISKTMKILTDFVWLNVKIPTHTTIINWIQKMWYYLLTDIKELSNDWIIILDETIQLWRSKLFAIYWIKQSQLPNNRALEYEDLTPLHQSVRKTTTWEIIFEIISKLEENIWQIVQAVCDWWNNLKKWLWMLKINISYDFTHKIAKIIEQIYKKDTQFIEIVKIMSTKRVKHQQTDQAYLIPPSLRGKSRFLNIDSISSWLIKIINFLSNISKEEIKMYESVNWVLKYKEFAKELYQINTCIKQIGKLIKTWLLTKETKDESIKIIEKIHWEKAEYLKVELEKYFNETIELFNEENWILVSSDILESLFWWYKNNVSNNCMAWITALSLIMPVKTSELKEEEIKKAFESTTTQKVIEWIKETIWQTLLQMRIEALNDTDLKWKKPLLLTN